MNLRFDREAGPRRVLGCQDDGDSNKYIQDCRLLFQVPPPMTRDRPSSILIQSPLERVISSTSSMSSRDFARHIRFAPLPEPDHEQHATDGIATPLEQSDPDPTLEDLTASSSSSSSANSNSLSLGQSDPEKSSPGSSVGSSPIILSSSSSKHSSSNSIHDSPPPPSSSEPHFRKPHLLLRPFKRFSTGSSSSSSNTLTPTSSIEATHGARRSKDEVLSLGVVNLFRTASRDSGHSVSSRWSGLGRSNAPFARSPSIQSHKSTSSSRFPIFSSSSSATFSLSSDPKPKPKAKPIPLGQQQRNRHKGTIIINGRVYGGSKNANPFASARDEEPEFVEWGYGGMGSVKGAKSAGVSSTWDRLQGGPVGVGGVGAGIGATDVELDDGSGMAWLKRRKEERERKAREQTEKEENGAEKENEDSQNNTPIPTRSPTMETLAGVVSIPSSSLSPRPVELALATTPLVSPLPIVSEGGGETATKYNFPTPTRPSELVPSLTENGKPEEGETSQLQNTHENERVLQAINVPLRSPRSHHHRRPSSKGARETSLSTEGPQVQVVGSPILVSPSGDDDDTTDASTGVLHTSTITPIEMDKPEFTSTSFSSSSGSEDEGDDDDDEEDDDEGQEEELQKRNALRNAAGVEKISRHNKE